jgi:hypothetical protein
MFPEEFLAAQRLLERAGAVEKSPPTPIDVVLDYLAGRGLELHYYDPAKAPPILQETANGVDEALVPQESRSLLFVNRDRPQTRIRFSIFHGTAHFCLPGHERLNYLSRGCAINPATYRRYERQANRFAAAMIYAASALSGRYAASPLQHADGGEPCPALSGLCRERSHSLRLPGRGALRHSLAAARLRR